MRFKELNKIPVRTPMKQQVNDFSLDMNEVNIEKFLNFSIESRDKKGLNIRTMERGKEALVDLKYGASKDLIDEANNSFTNGIVIEIDDNAVISENIIIKFDMNETNKTLVDNIAIIAGKNSKANIVIKYNSSDELEGYHNGVLRVFAKNNSNIKVSKINLLGKNVRNFDSNKSEIEEDAIVSFIAADLGGISTVSNYESILNGKNANADANAIYIGTGSEKIDMNYIMTIKGQKAIANMNVKGALKDTALKNFKGTLDFIRGAKQSKGSEEEYCMLLSDKARSRSVPLLLCEEDDVSGEHAAASGSIDENKLFYLMSRGISEQEARLLIINAEFNPIIDKIGCTKVQEEVLEYIKKVLV